MQCKKGSFPFLPPPPALLTKLLFPPLADMLSWAVWFKFLLNKVIANTCLFILTSFSKQSASWKVFEICELCALSTDSRKTYSVNTYMYTGSSSYSFDWGGGIIRWVGRNGKDPQKVLRKKAGVSKALYPKSELIPKTTHLLSSNEQFQVIKINRIFKLYGISKEFNFSPQLTNLLRGRSLFSLEQIW